MRFKERGQQKSAGMGIPLRLWGCVDLISVSCICSIRDITGAIWSKSDFDLSFSRATASMKSSRFVERFREVEVAARTSGFGAIFDSTCFDASLMEFFMWLYFTCSSFCGQPTQEK